MPRQPVRPPRSAGPRRAPLAEHLRAAHLPVHLPAAGRAPRDRPLQPGPGAAPRREGRRAGGTRAAMMHRFRKWLYKPKVSGPVPPARADLSRAPPLRWPSPLSCGGFPFQPSEGGESRRGGSAGATANAPAVTLQPGCARGQSGPSSSPPRSCSSLAVPPRSPKQTPTPSGSQKDLSILFSTPGRFSHSPLPPLPPLSRVQIVPPLPLHSYFP